jgi:hypothetical protein
MEDAGRHKQLISVTIADRTYLLSDANLLFEKSHVMCDFWISEQVSEGEREIVDHIAQFGKLKSQEMKIAENEKTWDRLVTQ